MVIFPHLQHLLRMVTYVHIDLLAGTVLHRFVETCLLYLLPGQRGLEEHVQGDQRLCFLHTQAGKGCQVGRTSHMTRICPVREALNINYASIRTKTLCGGLCLDQKIFSSLHLQIRTRLLGIRIKTHTCFLIIAFKKMHTYLQPQCASSIPNWQCDLYLPWICTTLYLSISKRKIHVSPIPQEDLWPLTKKSDNHPFIHSSIHPFILRTMSLSLPLPPPGTSACPPSWPPSAWESGGSTHEV